MAFSPFPAGSCLSRRVACKYKYGDSGNECRISLSKYILIPGLD